MISYEVYKVLHISTLFMVISALGAIVSGGNFITKKPFKVTVGILSFFIFVAGMGLIARLGFKHTEPFPAWIWVKMVSWGLLCSSLILLYRVKSDKTKIGLAMLSFVSVFTAVYSAITKFM